MGVGMIRMVAVLAVLANEIGPIVGNEGGFVHKSFLGKAIGGAVKGFITGGPTGALAGGIRSLTTTARPTVPRTQTARVTGLSEREKELGRQLKLGGNGGFRVGAGEFTVRPSRGVHGNGPAQFCPDGQVWNKRLKACLAVDSPVAAEFGGGQPVLGQHGSGVIAGSRIVDIATCNKGMVLGNDGVCYNKKQISNKERMWPPGRKPLLTGGDMRAITVASRSATRLEGATKRLQKMGMMKKPAARRATPAGHKAKLVHASEH